MPLAYSDELSTTQTMFTKQDKYKTEKKQLPNSQANTPQQEQNNLRCSTSNK